MLGDMTEEKLVLAVSLKLGPKWRRYRLIPPLPGGDVKPGAPALIPEIQPIPHAETTSGNIIDPGHLPLLFYIGGPNQIHNTKT